MPAWALLLGSIGVSPSADIGWGAVLATTEQLILARSAVGVGDGGTSKIG